jgi:hypothetical protein
MACEVSPLPRRIKPTGHPVLRTVEEPCAYMLSLPKPVAMLTHWQHAARLCMSCARVQPRRGTADHGPDGRDRKALQVKSHDIYEEVERS